MTTAAPITKSANDFALELYGQLRAEEGNVFLSPLSIYTALMMVHGGARGRTEKEIQEVLSLASSGEESHRAAGALCSALESKGGPGPELHLANAVWAQESYPIHHTYLALLQTFYKSELRTADFIKDGDGAKARINQWVEEKTNERIRDLIDKITPDNRMILVNAIYFLAAWEQPFEKNRTTPLSFYRGSVTSGDKVVTVPMMRQTDDFRYFEEPGVQVLEMPYKSSDLAMMVVLPRGVEGYRALEPALSAEKIDHWATKLVSKEVQVTLPRFEVEARFELGETLQAMGMSDAFSSQADFSGMTDHPEGLVIGRVIHQAFVKADEAGTEAAAATAVMMMAGSAMPVDLPPEFKADHPFLVLIRDRRTGAILFMGRIENPEH